MNALLFLHGVGGSHAVWERQLSYFHARGRRAIAWDQPGYGGTALVEPYDFERVAAALRGRIESLGAEPVVLVGHSMGGLVVQEAYARFPQLIRALVLCFTSASFGGGGGEFVSLAGCGHLGPMDQPDEFNAALDAFLARHAL